MTSGPCPGPGECTPANCHWCCALELIDGLIGQPGALTPTEKDQLLELRWQLRQAGDAEATLRLFCQARRALESRHYLVFYRLRRWLENHIVARMRPGPEAQKRHVFVRLDHYCVEAVRRACLCSALRDGEELKTPQLRFSFQTAPPAEVLEK